MTSRKARMASVGLKGTGMLASFTPLMVTLGVNWEKYAPTEYEGIKVGFGAVLIVVFMLIKTLDRLPKSKNTKMIMFFGILFALSFLFKSVIDDLFLLSGMALAGELAEVGLSLGSVAMASKAEELKAVESDARLAGMLKA